MKKQISLIPENTIAVANKMTMDMENLFRLDSIAKFSTEIMALVDVWECGHGQRSSELIEKLSLEMNIPTSDIVLLKYLAQIHDIGKIGIQNTVLARRKLFLSEMDMIRAHPTNGYNLIKDMGFDKRIGIAILQHHERWDGTGYPYRLKGLEISLWARLLLIVDTYDAISSERAHHKARTISETLKIMQSESGVKSDPEIFKIFKRMVLNHG